MIIISLPLTCYVNDPLAIRPYVVCWNPVLDAADSWGTCCSDTIAGPRNLVIPHLPKGV